jgi:hypothetical protein
MEKKYYHYTTATRLEEIIESGVIKLATESISHKKEKPCAWVSTNGYWERTATKLLFINGQNYQMSFAQQHEYCGCARIQVEPHELFSWSNLKKLAHMDKKMARLMEIKGIQMGGKPSEWFGSLKPISIDYWICAEIFDGEKWVEYDRFIIEEEFNTAA